MLSQLDGKSFSGSERSSTVEEGNHKSAVITIVRYLEREGTIDFLTLSAVIFRYNTHFLSSSIKLPYPEIA